MAITDREIEVSGKITDDLRYIEIDGYEPLKVVTRFLRDKTLLVKFTVHRKIRSLAQNRYIWGVVVPTVRAWYKESQGEVKTKDQVYTWLRVGIVGHKPVITEMLGTQVVTFEGKRFSKMNTLEFTEAIEEIIMKLAEMGCEIPKPREENLLNQFV